MEQVFESLKEAEKLIGKFFSEDYNVAESIMIENAAAALELEVKNLCSKKSIVTVLCGAGNNGADGYTLCRHLAGFCKINIVKIQEPKSYHCKLAFKNLKTLFENSSCQMNFYDLALMQGQTSPEKVLKHTDVVVDCIFGTGFHGVVNEQIQKLFSVVNNCEAIKIACDIPSGIDSTGKELSSLSIDEKKKFVFFADKTISMGANKIGLFSDSAKDCVGKISVASIGVSKELFFDIASKTVLENQIFLLKKNDLNLPIRKSENSHKGNYGHTCVLLGNKSGAGILAASSALKSGSGLSSLLVNQSLDFECFKIPASIMKSNQVPVTVNSFVLGSGFGLENNIDKYFELIKIQKQTKKNISVLLDADSFYYKSTVDFLEENEKLENPFNVVITPHPKEFSKFLSLSGLGEFSVKDVCDSRLELCRKFSKKFLNTVLVLKGANTFIASKGKVYISTLGSCALAKAGSGDVLAGIIASLMAQNYSALDAAINGVMMHGIASKSVEKNYSLTPELLIENL